MRQTAVRILAWQAGVGVLIAVVCLVLWGVPAGVSALAGAALAARLNRCHAGLA